MSLNIEPSGYYELVTPADGTDLLHENVHPTGLLVADAGALAVHDVEDNLRTFADGDLALNVIHPIRVKEVRATGTTATRIWVFWSKTA